MSNLFNFNDIRTNATKFIKNMLDFYLSNKSELEFPIEEDFVGGISFIEFELIQSFVNYARSIDIQFGAHSDFFIPNTKTSLLLKFISNISPKTMDKSSQMAYLKMNSIVETGINHDSGVYSFCD